MLIVLWSELCGVSHRSLSLTTTSLYNAQGLAMPMLLSMSCSKRNCDMRCETISAALHL